MEGQMSIFDMYPKPEPKPVEIPKPVGCQFSGHECNKVELWNVADELDETECPHKCCRQCEVRCCGARCNGSSEPEPKKEIGDWWRDEFENGNFGFLPLTIKPKDIGLDETAYFEIEGTYIWNGKETHSLCPAELVDGELVATDVPIDIPTPKWECWRFDAGMEITRKQYREEPFIPNRTFYRVCVLDFTIGNDTYWTPIYNQAGMTLEFYDREHAVQFVKEHPEAIGYHNYEIRPRTYSQELIDDYQYEYGRDCNVWDGFTRPRRKHESSDIFD